MFMPPQLGAQCQWGVKYELLDDRTIYACRPKYKKRIIGSGSVEPNELDVIIEAWAGGHRAIRKSLVERWTKWQVIHEADVFLDEITPWGRCVTVGEYGREAHGGQSCSADIVCYRGPKRRGKGKLDQRCVTQRCDERITDYPDMVQPSTSDNQG